MQSSRLLLIALAVTVGLTVWTRMQPKSDDDTDLAAPAKPRSAPTAAHKPAASSAVPAATANADIASDWQLQRPGATPPEVNLFAASVIAPPPPPGDPTQPGKPAKPAKPPKQEPPPPPLPPMAPPLPVRYLGRMQDGATELLFVSFNGDSIALKTGDTVAGSYRLDRINNNMAVFTYMPLNQTQTLVFGESP